MKTQILSTRIDDDHAKEIKNMASEMGLDKSAFLKRIILSGLQEFKLDHAIELFNNNKISLSRAAELAGISIYDLISLMPDNKMELNYSVENFHSDMDLQL